LACAALEQGHSRRRAAAYAGITADCWDAWVGMAQCDNSNGAVTAHIIFERRTAAARLAGEVRLGDEWERCWAIYGRNLDDDDPRVRMDAAAFLLKHRHGVYAAKAPKDDSPQRVELTGANGGPIEQRISPALEDMLRRMTPEQLVAVAQGSQDEVT